MIDRQSAGSFPAEPHSVFRGPDGKIVHEEMFTRGGFDGPFTYFYHRFPVPPHREARVSARGWPAAVAAPDGPRPLRRRLYQSDRVAPGGMLVDRRIPVLFNGALTVQVARPAQTDDVYFANGDGDELWFLRDGSARVESPCGWLEVRGGDYVWIPKSMIHRWHLAGPASLMGLEARGGVGLPRSFRNGVGQLRLDAPYSHRDFRRPQGPVATFDHVPEGPRELLIKKGGVFTRYGLDTSPMDVVGWDGFVYPFAFPIESYRPKTAPFHLPPTIHATFEGDGFVVCSFVPRLVDYDPRAVPCPYPHSSVDCDEILFYVRGDFTSRRGVGAGALSLHPAGVAHGPHPGAYEGSLGTQRTEELAVMVDTFEPLVATAQAAALEDPGYGESWA